jgi:catechol 2,3-dioxygenase-like lactoylglutathione lyase family enzyme
VPGPLSDAHTVTKLPAQDLERARAFYRDKLGLETTLAELRARGVTFERFEMSGFDVRGETIAAPDNYPSRGTGERGTFFYDSEGNLIGLAQPVREGATRG